MSMFWLMARSFVEVLVAGIIFGAGLPALFALGVRLLASTRTIRDADVTGSGSRLAARFAAYGIFALVVAMTFLGIAVIVASGMGQKVPI